MNRRHALQTCAAIAASSLLTPAASAEVKVERVITKVGKNHGHLLVVGVADVKAGTTRTYDLSGTSGHAHEVTLTPEHFKQLQAGGVVRLPSTRYENAGHLHRLLVKTAPLVDPPESVNVCEATFTGQDDHELVISAPDLAAGTDKVFDIQGLAPHGHTLSLAAGDFEKLRAGAPIKVRSSQGDDDGHTHLAFVHYPIKKSSAGGAASGSTP